MIYAVIDTNVLVSVMLSRNPEAATVKLFEAIQKRDITMLYNHEILKEYSEVLLRPKFNLPAVRVIEVLAFIAEEGIPSSRVHSEEFFPDPKDIVFYEVALSKEDAFLVTGNLKHFPKTPIVVTPAEMMEILAQKV